MSKVFEGFVLPILFIIIVLISGILGVVASVQTDHVDNNQTFTKEEVLEDANRNLIIGYILYFVSVGCVIISLLTHSFWKDSPAWLQVLLVVIALVTVVIGTIFTIIASNDLKNIIGEIRSLALWSAGLGIAGIVLAIILVYFRSVSYIREHEIQEEKQEEEQIENKMTAKKTTTTQVKTPTSTITSTTQTIDKKPYPMMLG